MTEPQEVKPQEVKSAKSAEKTGDLDDWPGRIFENRDTHFTKDY